MPSPVIDVHTHCLTEAWFELLQRHGGPPLLGADRCRRNARDTPRRRAVHDAGARDVRLRSADPHHERRGRGCRRRVAHVPELLLGGPEVSLAAARLMNDDMAAARTAHPDRLRWFASLPWQYPERALPELERAVAAGASGVMVLANVDGRALTDPPFAPIWAAIDAKSLPVLVHPTAPPGVSAMDMDRFQLTASIGFTFDTSLAVARMIYDGFFDRCRRLRIIAAHGGGTLPYLIARMDQCYDNIPACREKIAARPSEYVSRILADAVVFAPEVLDLCLKIFGADNVLYGSDYPHTIGDMPGCLKRVNGLPEAARDKVRGRNAQRVFGL